MKLIVEPAFHKKVFKEREYIQKKRPGHVELFRNEINRALFAIAKFPESSPIHLKRKNFRVYNLLKFKYKIIYRIENETIIVYTLRHHAQKEIDLESEEL